ncbi:MAG TPA: GDSL-type esterase/lipase family protein [Myxococcales bacterium]|nr:GDSL-type esterase/lipase family protein [Myxococcales bacterium]
MSALPRSLARRFAVLLFLTASTTFAAADRAAADVRPEWVTAWAGPQQSTTTTLPLSTAGVTLREPVWLTVGGDQVRVKFSNAMNSTGPLTITSASIGIRTSGSSVDAATLRTITFGGKGSVDVPIQGAVLSDPVALAVPALTDVSISIYLLSPPAALTQYPGSRKVTAVFAGGDATLSADMPAGTTTLTNGYLVSSVEVHNSSARGAVACVGDSITAGVGSDAENLKWSDRLAARLAALPAPRQLGVLGLGIAGNRVLSGATGNPAALARFDREVLGMAGLTHVILADGINDLGSTALTPSLPPNAADVEEGVRQLVERAHARGVKVIATTMGPVADFRNYQFIESKRLEYNHWLRTEGVKVVDGLVDFDAVLADPLLRDSVGAVVMRPALASGDGIHPNDAGHQAMADAIDLLLLK